MGSQPFGPKSPVRATQAGRGRIREGDPGGNGASRPRFPSRAPHPTPCETPMLLLHFATAAIVATALLEVARMVLED